MLKSILIGLDGSRSNDVAVELGVQWAKYFNALLAGLGIVDAAISPPDTETVGEGFHNWEWDEQSIEQANRRVKQILASFVERCTAADISCNVLQDAGLPYEEILRESQRYDLVLFGHETHFAFGIADRPDETLWNVLKRETRPVVIAPPKLEAGSSVVVAYNGSPPADRALQLFQSSGLDLGEEVCVVSADDREEARLRAGRAVEFLHLHHIKAETCVLEQVDSVSQAILQEVRRRNARLLVMGAYGHSTVREFLLGSITTTVLKESQVPVFLCH